MDWDRINAQDLFVLANSPMKNGRLLSVTIYVSEMGKSRIKYEEINGPKMK